MKWFAKWLPSRVAESPAEAPARPTDSNAFRLPDIGGARMFDPALKHLPRAYRELGPASVSPEVLQRWRTMQSRISAHVLQAISASPWGAHLVLRGSATLPAWLGDAARRPGDLDWVVLPPDWRADGEDARHLLSGVIEAVAVVGRSVGDAVIDVETVACDVIWAYERAEGRRLTFAWFAPGLPPGKLQCDIVFAEALWEPPAPLVVPLPEGESVTLLAATPEQSLAWKFLWLLSDWYPQGKDLYDAVMLAERYSLSEALLDRTLQEVRAQLGNDRVADRWMEVIAGSGGEFGTLEWRDFISEYPWIDSNRDAWADRFARALKPLLARDAETKTVG